MIAPLNLSVLENGTVDYDEKYDAVLDGRNTATVSVWNHP